MLEQVHLLFRSERAYFGHQTHTREVPDIATIILRNPADFLRNPADTREELLKETF